MATTIRSRGRKLVQRKNYRIDTSKLERTRRILQTRTETETIHRALDMVADEAALVEALRRFVMRGRGHIENVDASR
jgi:hypothetical protein